MPSKLVPSRCEQTHPTRQNTQAGREYTRIPSHQTFSVKTRALPPITSPTEPQSRQCASRHHDLPCEVDLPALGNVSYALRCCTPARKIWTHSRGISHLRRRAAVRSRLRPRSPVTRRRQIHHTLATHGGIQAARG